MTDSLGPTELLGLLVAFAAILAVVAYPAGRILSRLGFSPWLGLGAIVPIANVVLLLYVAFADWPAVAGSTTSARNAG